MFELRRKCNLTLNNYYPYVGMQIADNCMKGEEFDTHCGKL